METVRFTPRLRMFVDIAGYSGVSGSLNGTKTYSCWVCCPFSLPLTHPPLFLILLHPLLQSSPSLQVFVCGLYPHWVFMTQRGVLLLHPMFIDGPVTSFTPFHNVNCPRGFLYFNSEVCTDVGR